MPLNLSVVTASLSTGGKIVITGINSSPTFVLGSCPLDLGTAVVGSGNQPYGAYIDPSGKFGYIAQYAGPNGIKMYNVSSSDG